VRVDTECVQMVLDPNKESLPKSSDTRERVFFFLHERNADQRWPPKLIFEGDNSNGPAFVCMVSSYTVWNLPAWVKKLRLSSLSLIEVNVRRTNFMQTHKWKEGQVEERYICGEELLG
jgi:hypothetical protein